MIIWLPVKLQFDFYNEFLIVYANDFGALNLDQFTPFSQKEICCNTQMVLHDIVKCKMSGILKSMFLESKALSLLLCFQNEQNALSRRFVAVVNFYPNLLKRIKY